MAHQAAWQVARLRRSFRAQQAVVARPNRSKHPEASRDGGNNQSTRVSEVRSRG